MKGFVFVREEEEKIAESGKMAFAVFRIRNRIKKIGKFEG